MKLSGKITKIIAAAAILGMLAAPALASTIIHGDLLTGNGNGPGDGTGTGDGPQDGTGIGECDLGAVQFTTANTLLLASDQAHDRDRDGTGDGNRAGDLDSDSAGDQDRTRDCET